MDSHPAKPTQWRYKRHLPHINSSEKLLYITFSTRERWRLPESVRQRVLDHRIHDHMKKIIGCCAIVMPDHVHMIFRLLRDANGNLFGQAEILKGIKGASASSINKILARSGAVWEEESFDRIVRSSENLSEKIEYIWNNPVRKGLVKHASEYRWFWRGAMPDDRI